MLVTQVPGGAHETRVTMFYNMQVEFDLLPAKSTTFPLNNHCRALPASRHHFYCDTCAAEKCVPGNHKPRKLQPKEVSDSHHLHIIDLDCEPFFANKEQLKFGL